MIIDPDLDEEAIWAECKKIARRESELMGRPERVYEIAVNEFAVRIGPNKPVYRISGD